MGKNKPSKPSPKIPKHEKKPQIHNLNKIIRPKVFITESSNFKHLVQELTGNGPSPVSSPSPPARTDQDTSLEISFDSSCFSTPIESSPDSFSYLNQNISSQFMDLESLLMGIDSVSNNYESCYDMNMVQQEVCVYDYDLSLI